MKKRQAPSLVPPDVLARPLTNSRFRKPSCKFSSAQNLVNRPIGYIYSYVPCDMPLLILMKVGKRFLCRVLTRVVIERWLNVLPPHYWDCVLDLDTLVTTRGERIYLSPESACIVLSILTSLIDACRPYNFTRGDIIKPSTTKV